MGLINRVCNNIGWPLTFNRIPCPDYLKPAVNLKGMQGLPMQVQIRSGDGLVLLKLVSLKALKF
jgi:hypothetical protein